MKNLLYQKLLLIIMFSFINPESKIINIKVNVKKIGFIFKI